MRCAFRATLRHNRDFYVPSAIWLHLRIDHKDLKFNYPLIKNELTFSRCIFSQANFEISPNILNIKNITLIF